ncbi:alpha/beta fold hydrolase [Amycolatopsis saalfeldensis]|uniref:Pimeloyl-ACP methyl ester carboxylesterase n=1 Tax=Amycolatopsis saalfeldensis TaxID=394193 RepID=A0A1H8YPX1_9PSEU|nr:alpha/beta hydrolase [Amycolatopsis saalfeldensis]SEP54254.1 Pimeloyl-ACP methyl ester carboxylesterase [Amycolatopsis saalfeldensis]
MPEHLSVAGGILAYEVTGSSGPLVLLAHGIGNSRDAYRFVAPALADSGHRVAAVDLRGCGESSVDWAAYGQPDIADDLMALIRHLGGPAVLVGHSISGGAATIVAAKAPELVTAVVELGPFTRKLDFSLGDLRNAAYRRGALTMAGTELGSVGAWKKYLDNAYPGPKPTDWEESLDRTTAMLREPGRMKALQAMGRSGTADSDPALAGVHCPALVVMGTLDPDWASPQAEGEAIVAAMPPGVGRLEMIPGAGHYPHVQFPAETVTLIQDFLGSLRA